MPQAIPITWRTYHPDARPRPPTLPLKVWELSSPGVALYRHAMGADEPTAPIAPISPTTPTSPGFGLGLGAGVVAGLILLGVVVNYQLGKAMAPSKDVEGKWAWGNAIGGTLFPPFTIGMAVYKNYIR